ncbi:B12-binding domain-containing radical SAM protein [Pyrobaculum neutrophilum]|uniref:Radical SAM domain protein n=1 Tax=Pyrobaculum neutrophilum (strain DSM 2338 / JCM 9278 / NBRC 100436 / V24Sta) TaxID=444157 RepID=B1Y8P4_PYRNV|nr:radical SAM protein [Pyrobaculum neutrophilum]ACB40123.1 Radical SAM domain protein [Pyrobaculum neutrophilum V24Sta]
MRRVAYRKNAIKVALLYPSTYAVAMSSAVFHMLYFKLQDEGFYVERFTADRGPRGVEDGTPLSHFDYVVATVHYELDYVNLVKMLREAGLSPRSAGREKPRLVVGGPPVSANPEPLAEFADAVAVGELEPLWGALVRYIATGEEAEGLYYPARGPHRVKIAHAADAAYDYRRIPEPEAAFSLSVELARGCPYSCLFCMESYITKPYRPRDWQAALRDAEELYGKYGIRPSLVALTANAHPHFKDLLREALGRGVPLSLPSLRAELLDGETLELIAALGQRTLTIAPESSERLRKALGKDISDRDVLRVAEQAASLGLKIKMYLMVGLPCERDDDLEEVAELAAEAKRRGARLALSVNPFIPKPQTPLQYSAMEKPRRLREKIALLRRAPHDEFTYYEPELGAVQAALALGGREVAGHIEEAAGAPSPVGYLKRLLREGAFGYVFAPRDDPLPWGHVEGHHPHGELKRRYLRYLEAACG